MELLLTPVHSQPAWGVGNDNVELSLTQAGAMAPVTFYRGERRPIQPYYLSPWQGEPTAVSAPVLAPLRGDFFCLPFGSNAEPIAGECHPLHGEVAGSRWQLESCRQQNGCVALHSQSAEPRCGRATLRKSYPFAPDKTRCIRKPLSRASPGQAPSVTMPSSRCPTSSGPCCSPRDGSPWA